MTVKNSQINVQGHKVTVSSQFNGQKLLRIIDDTRYTLVEPNTKEVLLTIPLPLGDDIPRSVALHQIPGAHAKWEARSYRKKTNIKHSKMWICLLLAAILPQPRHIHPNSVSYVTKSRPLQGTQELVYL